MREHYYVHDGRRIAVAEMSNDEIHDCLASGVCCVGDESDTPVNRSLVKERLRLELEIRALGLR